MAKFGGDDILYSGWGFWKDVIKRGIYATVLLPVSYLYMVLNHYTGREREIITFIDSLIPFNPYFIFAYILWYFYVAIFIIYFCIYDERKYYKLLIGISAGMLICYVIYTVFPTTVVRPVFEGDEGVVGTLFKWLYRKDNPYNCFPSIHVLNTILVAIYVQKDSLYLNKYIKIGSLVCAAAIIYSTLAIKQHVVFDVLSAAVLSYGLHGILDYKEISEKFRSEQRESVSET